MAQHEPVARIEASLPDGWAGMCQQRTHALQLSWGGSTAAIVAPRQTATASITRGSGAARPHTDPHHVPDLTHHVTSDAQCVNNDFALDAFDVDGLCVGLHRSQQVSGASQAVHFVGQINLVLRGQTLHARRQVDSLPEIIEPLGRRRRSPHRRRRTPAHHPAARI
jgi:hypothetical protein